MERVFGLLAEARAVLGRLEHARPKGESASAEAERLLYSALVNAVAAGLMRTTETRSPFIRHASAPLGPMGAAHDL